MIAREVTFSADGARVYSAGELARLLNVAPSAVSQWRARGTLPAPAVLIPDPRYVSDRGFWSGAQVAEFLRAYVRTARRQAATAGARRRAAASAVRAARARVARAELALTKMGAERAPNGHGSDTPQEGRE